MDKLVISLRDLGAILALAGGVGFLLGLIISTGYHEWVTLKRVSKLEEEFQRLKDRSV